MGRTQVRGTQILDGGIKREDLNTTDAGHAVVTKVIAGSGMSVQYSGADSGTGDVTVISEGQIKLNGSDSLGYIADKVTNSIIVDGSAKLIKLNGDSGYPGANKYYGTDENSIKGFYTLPSGSGSPLTVKESDGSPSISNVTTIEFDQATGLNVTNPSTGVAKISLGSHFKDLQVSGQTTLSPTGEETLELVAGTGITLQTNATATPKQLVVIGTEPGNAKTIAFTNASLTDGVLAVTHNLMSQFVVCEVYDNNNEKVIPDKVTASDAANALIDLSTFSPLTGTWHVALNSGSPTPSLLEVQSYNFLFA